jgi:hypothetical protein
MPGAGPRRGEAAVEAYEYKVNANRMGLLMLLALGAVGAYWLVAREMPFEGWLALFAAVVVACRLARGTLKGACVRIDAEGVCDTRLKVGVVRWEDIERPYIGKTNGVPFLCLELKNPAAYRARMPASERFALTLYRLLGMRHVVIAASCLDADAESILAHVRHGCARARKAT